MWLFQRRGCSQCNLMAPRSDRSLQTTNRKSEQPFVNMQATARYVSHDARRASKWGSRVQGPGMHVTLHLQTTQTDKAPLDPRASDLEGTRGSPSRGGGGGKIAALSPPDPAARSLLGAAPPHFPTPNPEPWQGVSVGGPGTREHARPAVRGPARPPLASICPSYAAGRAIPWKEEGMRAAGSKIEEGAREGQKPRGRHAGTG